MTKDGNTSEELSKFLQRLNGTRTPLGHGFEPDKPVIVALGSTVLFSSNNRGGKIQSGRLELETPGTLIRVSDNGHEVKIASDTQIISNRRRVHLNSGESLFAEGASLSKPR